MVVSSTLLQLFRAAFVRHERGNLILSETINDNNIFQWMFEKIRGGFRIQPLTENSLFGNNSPFNSMI